MDLKDFVSEALRQIVEGVAIAQASAEESGAFINPADKEAGLRNFAHLKGARLAFIHAMGNTPWEIQPVEFDVAVTVTESADKKGGLGVVAAVVAIGGHLQTNETTVSATRVKFSVPVAFPHHPGTNAQEGLTIKRREARRPKGSPPEASPS